MVEDGLVQMDIAHGMFYIAVSVFAQNNWFRKLFVEDLIGNV